jgi:DNA-binding response OmpR family regulator
MGNQLLLVEDDENLGYILKEYLEMNEFEVVWAKDGEEGLNKFKGGSFDLCILDIMMPKKDGFTLAEEIKRENGQVPFVFLTAKTLKVDQLKGFDIGADDYIVKPVDEELLIARIRAILNRFNNDTEKGEPETYTIGRYSFDPNTRELTFDDQKVDSLTPREADLLELLCENIGTVLTRDEALETIWGDSNYFNRRIMDVYISKLRKYFNDDSDIEIKNVHSKGFILSEK